MSETVAPQTHRIASEDETIAIEAVHTPGYTHRLEIAERWPATMDQGEVVDQLAGEAYALEEARRQAGEAVGFDQEGKRRWIFNIGPVNAIGGLLDRARNFQGILDGLGYAIEVQTTQEGSETVTKKVCDYPSVERLNDFMDQAFNDGQGADYPEFANFEGGDFGVEDFMGSFVYEGRVLVGAEQPYNIHDLSDHALGWMGISDVMFNRLQKASELYLNRSSAELQLMRQLPPLTWDGESPFDSDQHRKFFNPSRLILTEMLSSFDRVTSAITEAAFIKERHSNGFRTVDEDGQLEMLRAADRIFSLQSPDMFGHFPNGLLGGHDLDLEELAISMYARYQRADEVGREMAASAS